MGRRYLYSSTWKLGNSPSMLSVLGRSQKHANYCYLKRRDEKTIKKSLELTRRRQSQITGTDFITKFMRKQRKNSFTLHRKVAGIWWLGVLSRVKPREHFSGRHSKHLVRCWLVSAVLSFVSVLYDKEFTSGSKAIKKRKIPILRKRTS